MTKQTDRRLELIAGYLQTFDALELPRPVRKRRGTREVVWVISEGGGVMEYSSISRAGVPSMDGGSLAYSSGSEVQLQGSVLRGVNLTAARLRRSRIDGARFIDCEAQALDLYQSSADGARFDGCDLRDANFVSVQGSVEFKGCDLDGMRWTMPPENYSCVDCRDSSEPRFTVNKVAGGKSQLRLWKGDRLIATTIGSSWAMLDRLKRAKRSRHIDELSAGVRGRCWTPADSEKLEEKYGVKLCTEYL